MVVRWYPGQDPLEDAALSSLKQLLHGLVCTKTGNKKKGGRNRAAVSTVTVGLLMCGKTAESQDHAWSSRDVRTKLNESRDQELVPFPALNWDQWFPPSVCSSSHPREPSAALAACFFSGVLASESFCLQFAVSTFTKNNLVAYFAKHCVFIRTLLEEHMQLQLLRHVSLF